MKKIQNIIITLLILSLSGIYNTFATDIKENTTQKNNTETKEIQKQSLLDGNPGPKSIFWYNNSEGISSSVKRDKYQIQLDYLYKTYGLDIDVIEHDFKSGEAVGGFVSPRFLLCEKEKDFGKKKACIYKEFNKANNVDLKTILNNKNKIIIFLEGNGKIYMFYNLKDYQKYGESGLFNVSIIPVALFRTKHDGYDFMKVLTFLNEEFKKKCENLKQQNTTMKTCQLEEMNKIQLLLKTIKKIKANDPNTKINNEDIEKAVNLIKTNDKKKLLEQQKLEKLNKKQQEELKALEKKRLEQEKLLNNAKKEYKTYQQQKEEEKKKKEAELQAIQSDLDKHSFFETIKDLLYYILISLVVVVSFLLLLLFFIYIYSFFKK